MSKKQKAALNALAEGIECGAQLRPQARGGLVKQARWNPDKHTYDCQTCALGAAAECAFMRRGMDEFERLDLICYMTDYNAILALYDVKERESERSIILEDQDVISQGEPDAIATLIYRLNDQLEWSRERIAAFLRELE